MQTTLATTTAAAVVVLAVSYLMPTDRPAVPAPQATQAEQVEHAKEARQPHKTAASRPSPDEETRKLLGKKIPVDFDESALDSVISYFRSNTGTDFLVNWPALRDAGIERDAPVSMKLISVPCSAALKFVLNQVAASATEPVDFTIVDGIVTISTRADIRLRHLHGKDRLASVRVYDCRDLIHRPLSPAQAKLIEILSKIDRLKSHSPGARRVSPSTGVTSVPGSFFSTKGQSRLYEESKKQLGALGGIYNENALRLVHLIRSTVVADQTEWVANGGSVGSITEYGGLLVVQHNADVQDQVEQFLDMLREKLVTPEKQAAAFGRRRTSTVNVFEMPDITITVTKNGEVLHDGRNIGVDGVQPLVKKSPVKPVVRVAVLFDLNVQRELMMQVVHEAGRAGARIVSVKSVKGENLSREGVRLFPPMLSQPKAKPIKFGQAKEYDIGESASPSP